MEPNWSLDLWFDLLADRLPAAFLPALSACAPTAAHYRGDVMGVFELPLSGLGPEFDFSVRLENAAQCLHGDVLPPLVADLLAVPVDEVPGMWIEHDLRRDAGRAPISCFRLADWPRAFETLLPRLGERLGERLGSAALTRLADALLLLPPAARLLYLFDLSARGRPALRCEIAAPPVQLLSWLEKVGACRQAEVLERLSSLLGTGDRPHVSLDFDGEWLPRVGLENSFRGQPPNEERWRHQLELLAGAGLVRPEEIEVLLAWAAVTTPGQGATRKENWPRDNRGLPLPGWLVTCLSHFKLALVPDGEIEAKAYLLFQYLAREARGWPSR